MANAKPVKMTAQPAATEDKVEQKVVDAAVTGEGEAVGYAQTDYDPAEVLSQNDKGESVPTSNAFKPARKPKSVQEVRSPYTDKQGNEKVFTFIVSEN